VRRGEAVAEVTATGARTKFGRAAELVRTAHVESSQQKAVLRVVRNLAMANGLIIALLVGYAYALRLPRGEIVPLVLTAILASIPVALPATFTLAAALGARALAKLGVLPTRLSAVDEAASIDVLCADKTGTLTQKRTDGSRRTCHVGLRRAACPGAGCAGEFGRGQDPVDAAIRAAAAKNAATDLPKLTKFVPFDPGTKMSEATAADSGGAAVRAVKGAFAADRRPYATGCRGIQDGERSASTGIPRAGRCGGSTGGAELAGSFRSAIRHERDSAALIAELHTLGVGVVMVTGDAPATATIVAHAVGLEGKVCPPGPIPKVCARADFAVFAGVLPEGKYTW